MKKNTVHDRGLSENRLIEIDRKIDNSSGRIHNQYLKDHIVFVNQSRIRLKTPDKIFSVKGRDDKES